jgi:hypothetical protein
MSARNFGFILNDAVSESAFSIGTRAAIGLPFVVTMTGSVATF